MSAPADGYRLANGVILVPVDDGSARLLDMGGSFFALTRSGAEMVQGVLTDGAAATVATLAGNYGVEQDRIRSDLDTLLGELVTARLIEANGDPSRSRGWRGACARALVPLALSVPGVTRAPRALLAVARMSFLAFGWSDTVSAFGKSLRAKAAGSPAAPDSAEVARIDDMIRAAAARMPSVACKERALGAWYLLGRQGVPVSLVVGIQLYPLGGHCWCEADGRVITDFADHCAAYKPVARYEAQAAG